MPRKPLPDNLNKNQNIIHELQNIELKKSTDVNQNEESETRSLEPGPSTAERLQDDSSQVILPISTNASSKSKVNLYLDEKTKPRLEQAQVDLRLIVPRELSSKINQSAIVDVALRIILDEFSRTRENSSLVKNLIAQLRTKK